MCTRIAATLYGALAEPVVRVSSLESAELATFIADMLASVNIGLLGKVARLCERGRLES